MEAQPANPPLHDAPTYGLPAVDKHASSLLLVYLTDLDEAADTKLTQLLQPALHGETDKLYTWKPSTDVLRFIACPSSHIDSQANLYAVAALAYRAGWTGLVVADNLTKRQLNGTTEFGESRLPTVVMISIKPRQLSPMEGSDQVRVIAKRTIGWKGESAEIHHMLDTIEPGEVVRPEEMYRKGMVLHDSDRDLFTPDFASLLAKENLSNATHGALAKLPNELLGDILTRAGDDQVSQPIELPSWIQNDEKHLNIFLLFPTMSEELDKIQSTIQKSVQTMYKEGTSKDGEEIQVKLIPWEHHHVKSRRQLRKLWDAYQLISPHYLYSPALYFLLEPVKDAEHIQLGTCYYDMEFPMNISWKPLGKVIKMGHLRGLEVKELPDTKPYDVVHLDHESNEVMLSPNQPFYPNGPISWPGKGRLNWVVVFYLTNKLTDEQDRTLRAKIYDKYENDPDEEKLCCYVTWKTGHKDEPDGTVEDMWEMYWHCLRNNLGVLGDDSTPIFCIDQQSGIDNKLVVLEGHHFYAREEDEAAAEELLKDVERSDIRGMRYGRINAETVHNVHANLSLANMDFEEILDMDGTGEETPIHIYPRPGWPGHGILRDADEEDEEAEEDHEDGENGENNG